MCADDVVCSGAAPLFFLDYVAVGPARTRSDVAELVGGIAAGCREAGCALVGGETAEHPGLMERRRRSTWPGSASASSSATGSIDGSAVRAGDAIVGLAATGLHANGFSLVRALLAQYDLDLRSPYQERLRRSLGDAATRHRRSAPSRGSRWPPSARSCSPRPGSTPGRSSRLRAALEAAGHGSPRHRPHHRRRPARQRARGRCRTGLAARLDPGRWPMPSVMRLFGALGGLEDDELRATFNGGLGMVVVVAPEAVEATLAALAPRASRPGGSARSSPVEAVGGRRYAEGPIR